MCRAIDNKVCSHIVSFHIRKTLTERAAQLLIGRSVHRQALELYIRTEVHTAGGVMQDTQNRGAYLRMTVPLAVRAAAAVLEEGEAGETGVQ